MAGTCLPITIIDHPGIHLVGLTHHGTYQGIGAAFDPVFRAIYESTASPGRCFAIYHDDPSLVPADRLRSFAGVAWSGPVPAGLEELDISAGGAAELLYTGPYAGLLDAYRRLCREWLPASGCEVAGAAFEEYLNDPCTTAPESLQMRIRLPLRRLAD